MGPRWDDRHKVPVFEHDTIESLLLPVDQPSRNIVRAAGTPDDCLDLETLFIPNDSETLIVALHGALVRADVDLPRFEWLGTLRDRSENLLFVADSTLSLSEKLTLGWYIGTAQDDLTTKIARLIERVRKLRGIKKIILIGSSGGGYAALALASLLDGACAIAFSPQTNVFDFTPGHTKNLLDYVFPEMSGPEEMMNRWPERFSLIERYKKSARPCSFLYFQNLGDIDHVIKHKKPFAESLGVRLPNGRTFDQAGRFISIHHGSGHVRPPTSELPRLITEALDMLDTPTKNRLRSANLSGDLLEREFNAGKPGTFKRVPPEMNSYYSRYQAPLRIDSPNITYTTDGVPLRVIDGHSYDHPVLQAQFLFKLINNYRIAPSDTLRTLMDCVFERLVAQSIESREARYLPYMFPWHQGKLQPPWYSAMAQGQALGAVIRLYEMFGDNKYLKFADALFRSFTNLRQGTSPWVVDIDSEGFLWFEEYPYGDHGMGVLNGHLFAVWGVYDYWRVTDSNLANELATAALMTTKRYFQDYRNPGWSSHYDLSDFLLIRNYHTTHINQFESTYSITDDAFFLSAADILERDFPAFQQGGDLYCASGAQAIVKTDHDVVPTEIVESKQIFSDEALSWKFSRRTKFERDPGIWYLIASGEYIGWWIREEYAKVFAKGCINRREYARPRRALFTPATYVSYDFNKFGTPINPTQTEITEPWVGDILAKALWRGRWYFQLGEANFARRWIETDASGLLVQ